MTGGAIGRILLGAASLGLIALLVFRDVAAPGPGPLHPAHAGHPDLAGVEGCAACHGQERGPQSMTRACLVCHSAIAKQLDDHAGLHGLLSDAGSGACSGCHGEHQGEASPLVGDSTFLRAGFAGMEAYAHEGLDFRPVGMHLELSCDRCHPNAYKPALAAGEERFLGLESSCISCHADPHGGRMQKDCGACHSQNGPFSDPPLFEHTSMFPLEGRHRIQHGGESTNCASCHAPSTAWSVEALSAAPPERPRGCAECHGSPHSDTLLAGTAGECASCHSANHMSFQDADLEASAALHGTTGFALEGAHGDVSCDACHGGQAPFEERHPGREMNDCAACHVNVHGALGAAMTDCASCHGTSTFHTPLPGSFDHGASTGFELSGAHGRAECTRCHVAPAGHPRRLGSAAATFPGPRDRCSTCHDDPHGGLFDRADLPATGARAAACDSCHTTESFVVVLDFDHGASTGFELDGAHGRAECTRCHVAPQGHPRRLGSVSAAFPGSPQQCATCHEDPHDGFFGAAASPGTDARGAACSSCHDTESFLVVPDFDHGASTGFELDGAHAQTECVRCHVAAQGHPQRLGSVTVAFPGPRDRCSTCHLDPHGGFFDERTASTPGAASAACDSCHTPLSFHSVPRFDHGAATGFHLEGAHAGILCSGCHRPQPLDALGRTAARAPGASCSDCHSDPHLGQFDDGPTKGDCSKCHGARTAFSGVTFDHSTTRFPLDEKHARLECAACHQEATTATGRTAVRYRPLGRECVDCHDPSGRGGDRR